MDERARSGHDRAPDTPASDRGVAGAAAVAAGSDEGWIPDLPPPPFVDRNGPPGTHRFAPLSARVAVLIGATVIVGLLLWLGRGALQPFLLGLIGVYLVHPLVRWLSRHRIPSPIAVLVVYAGVVFIVVEFLNLTLAPLVGEVRRLIADIPRLAAQLDAQLQRLAEIYAGLALPDALREWIDKQVQQLIDGTAGFDPGIVLPILTGAGGILGALFGYIILPVWAFFLLKDGSRLSTAFGRALPESWRPDTWAMIGIFNRVFGRWIRAQIVLGVTVGVFTYLGLMALGEFVDPVFARYALLLSIIAGVLELLPIIGPIIAAIPAIIIGATVGIEAAVAALVLYTLVQQVENNLLVPKIQGDAVNLHPSAVIFALVIGGSLAGLLGAILALPVAATGRDIVRYLFQRMSTDDPDAMRAVAERMNIERPATGLAPSTPAAGAGGG
jgi:predicted PurR-regulated permease PerM